MEILMDFEWILDGFWKPNFMISGVKMLLKINQKMNEILDAFLMRSGAEIAKKTPNNSVPGGMRGVPGF